MRGRSRQSGGRERVPALGYAMVGAEADKAAIAGACERLGLELIDVVGDREPDAGVAGARPGLERALSRLDTGEASCLVVSGLDRLGRRVEDFASVVDRLEKGGTRLIALDVGLDTADAPGQLAVARRPPRRLPWVPEEAAEEESEPAAPEPEPEAAAPEPEPATEPELATPESEPDTVEPEPEAAAPEPEPSAVAPEPEAAAEPEAPAPEPEAAVPEPQVAAEPEAPPAEPEPDATPIPSDADGDASVSSVAITPMRAVGYASASAVGDVGAHDLDVQRQAIQSTCETYGCELVEIVADREPKDGKAFDRPGLSHALERIAAGDAACLVVSGLERLSRSVAELGTLVRWLEENGIRLMSVDIELDTASPAGRSTARALASVGEIERSRISERTRKGLAAARAKRHEAGDQAATDWAALRKRIAEMRADGMTLQAIADVLNAEGVPTQRGGTKWRPSSVQTAAGYKRRVRPKTLGDLPRRPPSDPT